ncbi:hypothetical protein GCM10028813_25080 [Ramlibacter alkalitolerans]
MWSVERRTADRRVSNAQAVNVGPPCACFGATESPNRFNLYVEMTGGELAVSGKGECPIEIGDMPEKGMSLARCVVPLKLDSVAYTAGCL